jgi:hypothetical protein
MKSMVDYDDQWYDSVQRSPSSDVTQIMNTILLSQSNFKLLFCHWIVYN